ncbi:MAG: hypothetical protein E7Y34_02185 [Mycoplasma sp.]|nr:hypothetical protein [Mycoplasma sp.]
MNNSNTIVIKRTQLKSIKDYASTLIHEFAHATSGYTDSTREFEDVLCQQIGLIVSKLIS